MRLSHPIEPFYDSNSEILILGSFPSVKSREQGFFYGHPQNRFWRVIAAVMHDALPDTVDKKKAFLKRNQIALWDVIARCDIEGSSDASIRNVTANDLSIILNSTRIRLICCNGATSWNLYNKYIRSKTGREAIKLPSTSPANTAWSLARLTKAWKAALSLQ